MNNNERDIIVALTQKLTRNNKQQLNELIKKTSHDLNTLKILIPALMPSHDECKHFVCKKQFDNTVKVIAYAIYASHNTSDCKKEYLEYFLDVIATVKSAMKKDRKATEDLYVKSVKTNLTQAEYDKLQHLRKSLNYSSIAAFVRDAAIQALDVKPQQDNEFRQYFEETSKLSKAIRDIAENLDDKKSNNKLAAQLKALKKQVDSTRKLAVDSHSSVTAKILAKKYLSARQLEILLKEKLEEEKNQ